MSRCSLTLWIVTSLLSYMTSMAEAEIMGCPRSCLCELRGKSFGVAVRCLEASSVPHIWPEGTTDIEIWFTSQPSNGLPPGSFSNLVGVRSISLRGHVGDIHSEAFYNITGVLSSKKIPISKITFWSANIDTIKLAAFHKIRHMNIQFTASVINKIQQMAFSEVTDMEYIDLWTTTIDEIANRAFSGVSTATAFIIRSSKVNYMFNYAFTGIRNVRNFSTPGLEIGSCMGDYAFIGMVNVHIDLSGGVFPIKPIVDSRTSKFRDSLKCMNGWRISGKLLLWIKKNLSVGMGKSNYKSRG